MKKTWAFYAQSPSYFVTVFLFQLFVLEILGVGLLFAFQTLLDASGINYLSYDNIGPIFMHQPFIAAWLILLLLVALIAIFWEFSFMILLNQFIIKQEHPPFRALFRLSLQKLKKVRLGSLLFFFIYFMLLFPLSGMGSSLGIISNIRIPDFVLEFIIHSSLWGLVGVTLFYCLCFYITFRLIFTLPYLILTDKKISACIKSSWILSRHKFFTFLAYVISLFGSMVFFRFLLSQGLVNLQKLFDQQFPQNSALLASLLMLGLQLFSLITMILSLLIPFFIVSSMMDFDVEIKLENKNKIPRFVQFIGTILTLSFVLIFTIGLFASNYSYLTSNNELSNPMVISHRGVSNGNGAQNTIPALIATSKTYHPAYVEMDIRLTKDNKWVVMHDANLFALTGVNKKVNQLTLNQLEKLTVHDNNHSAPVASFSDYFKEANRLHQKLLIEIKSTNRHPQKLVEDFLKQYGDEIVDNQAQIHSLNFNVIQELRTQAPAIKAFYIMIFNSSGVPESKASGFSMEKSTLDQSFVSTAQSRGQEVYTWDIDDAASLQQVRSYGVDAVITDNIPMVKNTMKESLGKLSYAQKLNLFVETNQISALKHVIDLFNVGGM
ncbi:glycerophosphodiester phosphodiesterase [Lactococcus fujiensis]|uniref:glycerophosphodiester phosphodiesterase n=1 Tax=Lactococcus fujiensis TaxID=610251 RepID=UPI0015DFAE58|nr:glycerophosphodiester phosphodiesterase [Lactococcus fujiensis]